MIYAIIFAVAVLRVFARAGQQLNVTEYRWMRVPAYSYLMAAGDFALWGSAFALFQASNWWGFALAVIVYGTAGWLGAVVAMWVHKRMTR